MSNQDQADFWNGETGQRWVEFSGLLDAMLRPFAQTILSHANIAPTDNVLDIGCGAGALSLMAAKEAKSVVGADISAPLIDLAAQRASGHDNVQFTLADAAELNLEAKSDVVISRFGVMFFNDPVKAFANIKRQVKRNGRMVFACWQSPQKNMWARAPLEAAQPFLTQASIPPQPQAPGPFAFADTQYLTDVLMDAGWDNVTLTDWRGDIRLPGKNPKDTASFMMEMGPLSRLLKEQDLDMEPVQQALVDKLSALASPDGSVQLGSAVWIVHATA